MVNKLTRRLIGILAMMVLMMTTSLSVNATCYFAGSATNWQNNREAMTDEGDGIWTYTKAFAQDEEFKIMVDDVWYGMPSSDYWGVTETILNTGEVMNMVQDNANLRVLVAGTYTLIFDSSTKKLRMGAKAPVTKKTADHGTLDVDPTEAIPGQTITITATPAEGYYIEVGNITVEKTINGGSAQAPGLRDNPAVGQFITDIVAGENNTFTFAMPESPYGAQVSAEFQERTTLAEAMFKAISEQDYTGLQITPTVECADGYELVLNTDYTVAYGDNIGPGENVGVVTITGIGKYKGTVTLYFTIKQGVHNVNITTDENGQVTADPASGVQGTSITLTVKPNPGYELETLTVDGVDKTEDVTNNTFSFTMPDADVAVNATFKAIDYTITVNQGENGTIAVVDNKTTAHYGDVITLTNTPNEDCVFVSYTVTDGEGNPVTVENNQFTMPASNVTVTATFRALTVFYEIRWGVTPEGATDWSVVGGTPIAMTKDETTGKWVLADQDMEAGREFKVVKNVQDGENTPVQTWYGAQADGNYWITNEKLGAEIQLYPNGSYKNLYFPTAGTYTFTFDPATNILVVTGAMLHNVNITTPVNGAVTAEPATAKAGTEVTLTITPAEGYEVGTITVMNGETPVTVTDNKFTMPDADVTVTVTFNAIDYTITVEDSENGTVTANQTTAHFGDNITLTITPAEDCKLVTLTVDGEEVTVEGNTYTFAMPSHNVTVTATFRALEVSYQINYGKGNPWAEVLTIAMTKDETTGKWATAANQEIEADYEAVLVKKVEGQADVVMQAQADGQYWVTNDKLGENIPMGRGEGYGNLLFKNLGLYTFTYDPTTKNLVITGAFEYTITVNNTTPDYGAVEAPAKAKAGDDVTLTVNPNEGYRVETLTVTYGEDNTEVEVTDNAFTMPAGDVTVTVSFTRILTNNALTWNVPAEKGTIEVKVDDAAITSGTEVQEGKTVVVTVTPTDEWTVSKVSVNNEELTLADGVYTFTMPAAPAEIVVEFTAVQHNITITPNEYVTVEAPATAAAGENVTITVTPNNADDFVVDGVVVNNGAVTVTDNEDGTYTFEMPAGADGVTIDVTVKAKIQGVSFTADRNWATYIGAYNLVKPEGVKVYVVNGVVNDAVDITEIDYIPAGVGVLLYGTAGEDFTTPLYTGETSTYTSLLAGSATEAQPITSGYVLYNNNFIRSEEGTVAAHRCYLPATQVQGAPRMLKIGVSDVPTAIESIIAQGNVAGVKYVNMSGMTSNEPFRGINIAVITFTDGTTRTVKVVK